MLTKKQMYMLIGFIVIIIASLVVMPETDGFKTFWGTFGLSKRRKGKNGTCSKRELVDNGLGKCITCYDKSKNITTPTPLFNKLSGLCVTCGTLDPTKSYYNPVTKKCVDVCPNADTTKTAGTALYQGTTTATSMVCNV